MNACSSPFSGDHTSWSLPGSGVRKQESHQRCKFILYIQKRPWDALGSAGNFVCHQGKPGWCFLSSKSHLVPASQRHCLSALWDPPAAQTAVKACRIGVFIPKPHRNGMPRSSRKPWNLAAVANSSQAVWESGIMLNSRICSTSWNKIAVLKLPVDRNHRFSIKLTLKKGLLSRETFLLKPFFKTKMFPSVQSEGVVWEFAGILQPQIPIHFSSVCPTRN